MSSFKSHFKGNGLFKKLLRNSDLSWIDEDIFRWIVKTDEGLSVFPHLETKLKVIEQIFDLFRNGDVLDLKTAASILSALGFDDGKCLQCAGAMGSSISRSQWLILMLCIDKQVSHTNNFLLLRLHLLFSIFDDFQAGCWFPSDFSSFVDDLNYGSEVYDSDMARKLFQLREEEDLVEWCTSITFQRDILSFADLCCGCFRRVIRGTHRQCRLEKDVLYLSEPDETVVKQLQTEFIESLKKDPVLLAILNPQAYVDGEDFLTACESRSFLNGNENEKKVAPNGTKAWTKFAKGTNASFAVCQSLALKGISSPICNREIADSKTIRTWFEVDPIEIERIKHIGSGYFGDVWLVRYRSDEFVIKCFRERNHPKFESFFREFQILSSLRSPRIVQLIGACFDPSEPFIVCEYLKGGSLTQVLQSSRRLSDKLKARMMVEMLKGLIFLHSFSSQGHVIHRDLTSDNVLLDEDLHVKISDFGLSAFLAGRPGSAAYCGRKGNWYFTASEIWRGENFTTASDVFSCGLIIWQIISRQKPFHDIDFFDIPKLVGKQGVRPSLDLPEFQRGCWSIMVPVLKQCWDPMPVRRPTLPALLQSMINIMHKIDQIK